MEESFGVLVGNGKRSKGQGQAQLRICAGGRQPDLTARRNGLGDSEDARQMQDRYDRYGLWGRSVL